MSRLTSETNPESGTTNYAYDSVSGTVCAPTSPGNLIKRSDANGNYTCFNYDLLHRLTDIGNNNASATNPGRRFRYDNSPGYAGSTKPAGLTNTMGRLIEAATDVGQPSNDAILTDEWFSYTARGEVSDVYQSMPHSGGYYHLTQSYWGNGATNQLNGLPGLPTLTYGVDGEGRVSTLSASSGQNPVTGVTYNAGSLPTQVNFGSGDSDIFAYDANTLRQTQYQFNINGQSDTGTLTWNANSTLSQLTISDAFNSADTQTCNYAHDDLSRIAQADCGSGGWGQSFTYDPFGNISKNVLASHTGNSFQPTYNSATNRFWSIPGATVSYDANGNVLTDGSHTYAWDADGNSISLDGVGLTFDALDRMVEQNNSGTYTEIVYSPGGAKLALMSGQTLQKAFIPLPGRATAVYTSSGLDHYRHSDWLGSVRLTSSPTRAVLSTAAYASFGETYAQSGTADLSFTGQNADTVSGDYDFLYRECSNQGRWASPDAAGLAAVDSSNPQSWNRYAYVLNNPMVFVDPSGLAACHFEMVDAILQTYMRVLSENGDPVINPEWNLVDEQRGQVGILACSSGPERLGGGGGGGGGGGIGTALAKINQIKTLCDKARSSGGGQIPFDGGVVSFDSSGGLMAGSVDLGHGMGFASAQLAGRDSVGRPSVIFSFSKPYNVGGATIDSVLFSGSEPSPMGRGQVGAFTAATGTVGRLGGSLAELLILHNLNGSQQARGAANLIGSLFGSPCEGILADLALVGRF